MTKAKSKNRDEQPGWSDVLSRISALRHKGRRRESIFEGQGAVGVVTFRFAADGVARVTAQQIRALQGLSGAGGHRFSRVVTITGGIDAKYWADGDLGDRRVVIRGLGLDNPVSGAFYQPLVRGSASYRKLPANILAESERLASEIGKVVRFERVRVLLIANVNSLPYNICGALALVMVSERLRVPVLNVCHDFYWEHSQGTRKRFFVNQHLPEVAGLIRILCPWPSPLWRHVTTTRASRDWLVARGWDRRSIDVLPYTVSAPSHLSFEAGRARPAIAELERRLERRSPRAFNFEDRRGVQVCARGVPPSQSDIVPFVFLLPVKISSGKRIDSAIHCIRRILEVPRMQHFAVTQKRRIVIVCAGPIYDVDENRDYRAKISQSITAVYESSAITPSIRNACSFLIPHGVPSSESHASNRMLKNSESVGHGAHS